MAHAAEFGRREFANVTSGAGCLWDKPERPLEQAFFDDMSRVGSAVMTARQVCVPWLILDGLTDDVVPLQDSRDLLAVAGEPNWFTDIAESDHVFFGSHASEMASTDVAWMRQINSEKR